MATTIGEKIRDIRKLKGLTQENMADMLHISEIAYGDIERNKTKVTTERLEQIAEKLGVTIFDILAFGDKVSNFFDNSSNAGVVLGNNQINHYDQRELVFTIEKQKLEIEKLQLEVEKLKLEKEKLEQELKFRSEKA